MTRLDMKSRARATCMWSGLLLCMLTLRVAAQEVSPAQPPAPANEAEKTTSYRIAGRIVSALDGHPLRQATVQITEVRTGRNVASTVSGEAGEFAFEGLRANKYSLSGETYGYLGARYDQHEQYSTAIVTGAGLKTEALVLRLTPFAALSGRVIDEAGEPVRDAQVMFFREVHGAGKTEVVRAGSALSDDLGEYALGSLAEGKYYVAAKGAPWYAVHAPGREQAIQSTIVTGVDPALDAAYPVTFYPGVTEQDAATPIQLKGGDQIHIDLHLTPVRAVRLSIHTLPGEQGFFPQLQEEVFGVLEPVMTQMQNSSGSTMEIVGLTPGHYEMIQMDSKTGRASKTRAIELANGSSEVDAAGGDEAGTVRVSLQEEGGGKLPAQMRVVLIGTNRGNSENLAPDEKGELMFAGLRPDDYHFQVFGGGRAYRVVAVKRDGQPLAAGHLRVSGGDTSVSVVISSNLVAVEGVAKHDDRPAAGAMLLLVPIDAINNADLFRRDQSDLDGTFVFPNAGAGRYIVVAIEDGWTLDWSRAEVLAHYLVMGVPLEILDSARQTIHLPDAVLVQPR